MLWAIAGDIAAQDWLTQLPVKANGRVDYSAAKEYLTGYRHENPDGPVRGEKQFLRAQFLLDNRMGPDGTLPSGIFWSEGKRVLGTRATGRSVQSPWEHIGPVNSTVLLSGGQVGGSGRIDCITFHPTDPGIIYVGTPSGGLWRTADAGNSWEVLTDDLPVLGVSDVDLHPNDPNTIFLCTGTRDVWWETYTIGILKSQDGGATWGETGLQYSVQENMAVHELWIHPVDPEVMVAAASNGLLRTVDGGDTWQQVRPGNFMDLEQMPGNPQVLYATTFSIGGGARLYKSVNAGLTFDFVNTGVAPTQVNRIALAVTPADPNRVYCLYSKASDHSFHGIAISGDQGATWAMAPNTMNLNLLGWTPQGTDAGGQGWFTLAIAVDPADPQHIHVGGVNIWESTDEGATWTLNAQYYGGGAQYVHADIHTLAYNPVNQHLYNSNDGGLYHYDNTTSTWGNRSDGLKIMQFYRVGAFRQDAARLLGSPQDNGTVLFTDTVDYELLLAEACDNFFDYQRGDTMFFGGYGSGLRRSYNGGVSSVAVTPPGESRYRFNPPFIQHPDDPATLFCAFKNVWKSTNRGSTWTKLTNNISGGDDFNSLEVAPSDPGYLYAATLDQIWVSADGGNTWQNIRAGLPSLQSISDIVISSVDPQRVWVTMGGFTEGSKVFRSNDAGATWVNVSGNLPNVPATCLAYEPGSDDAIYVGTDIGVFYTNNALSEWVDYSRDLPAVIIGELEVHTGSGKIIAATYGRGMWQNALADPLTVGAADRQEADVSVRPNPASDRLWIDFHGVPSGRYTISLLSADGNEVLTDAIHLVGMNLTSSLDLNDVPAGFYLLRCSGENLKVIRKVIVSR